LQPQHKDHAGTSKQMHKVTLTRFKFQQINMDDAMDRIKFILKQEGMDLSPEVVNAVIKISKGDMRKIINIFQNIHLGHSADHESSNKIQEESGIGADYTPDMVYRLTGNLSPEDVRKVFNSLMREDMDTSMQSVERILTGADANVASLLPGLTDLAVSEIQGKQQMTLKLDVLNVLADLEKKAARDIPEALLRDYMVAQFFILRNEV
jgi:replication factor C subunit 3/5